MTLVPTTRELEEARSEGYQEAKVNLAQGAKSFLEFMLAERADAQAKLDAAEAVRWDQAAKSADRAKARTRVQVEAARLEALDLAINGLTGISPAWTPAYLLRQST